MTTTPNPFANRPDDEMVIVQRTLEYRGRIGDLRAQWKQHWVTEKAVVTATRIVILESGVTVRTVTE